MRFTSTGELIAEWGSLGDSPGQFNRPAGIALSPNNRCLYVVDSGNECIQKFLVDGTHVCSWGSAGTQAGEFNFNTTSGMWVDKFGIVFVADSDNGRIQVFDCDGSYLAEVGTFGWGKGRLAWPAGVTVHERRLFALDTGGNEVEFYHIEYPCFGDIDDDGDVDGVDLVAFRTSWYAEGLTEKVDEIFHSAAVGLRRFADGFGRTNCL